MIVLKSLNDHSDLSSFCCHQQKKNLTRRNCPKFIQNCEFKVLVLYFELWLDYSMSRVTKTKHQRFRHSSQINMSNSSLNSYVVGQ